MFEYDLRHILQIDPEADDQAVQSAYVAQIKAHPPDTDPQRFEQIRDAYALMRDPRQRARHVLMADPHQPLASLLEEPGGQLRFVGPGPWLEALSERTRS